MATLADALRQFGPTYLATHALSTPQAKAWRAIVTCHTAAALGGERLDCDHCGHSHWQYHSCRNRHRPTCGARAKEAWLQGRLSEVLNVPYVHLVLTLPHCLNDLSRVHPRWVIDTLFACTGANAHGVCRQCTVDGSSRWYTDLSVYALLYFPSTQMSAPRW
jgi:hypothetical protein